VSNPIVIIGAGVAGQTAARHLIKAGHDVVIFDSDDRPGGRLKTDQVSGFRLDRGFQVYFTAYPNASKELDHEALDFRIMEPGALVHSKSRLHEIHRDKPVAAALSGFIPLGDKVATLAMIAELQKRSWNHILDGADSTAEAALQSANFSPEYMDKFLRPFFGGIFLDKSLKVSATMFKFVWKMLLSGDTVVPRLGIEEISNVLELGIPIEQFKMGSKVDEVIVRDGAAVGVRLASGEEVPASTVIVATEAASASKLSGVPFDTVTKGSTCIYFHAPEAPVHRPIIVLNGDGTGTVNHVVPMSEVSKAYAPQGEHLVSATILGLDPRDNQILAEQVQEELSHWFVDARVDRWRPLRVYRIAGAQMAQRPGFRSGLPANATPTKNLYLAGEFTEYSSIDGAVLSGQKCAATIMNS
jgi:phytoene dehydrogenase-like protein